MHGCLDPLRAEVVDSLKDVHHHARNDALVDRNTVHLTVRRWDIRRVRVRVTYVSKAFQSVSKALQYYNNIV